MQCRRLGSHDGIRTGLRGIDPQGGGSAVCPRAETQAAHIIDGRVAHSVLLEDPTDAGVGTRSRSAHSQQARLGSPRAA